MRAFSELYKAVDLINNDQKKTELLYHYLLKADDRDKIWILALLGAKGPKALMSVKNLTSLALEVSNLPGWIFKECLLATGDIQETIASILPAGNEPFTWSFSEVCGMLYNGKVMEPDAMKSMITSVWRSLPVFDRYVFNRLLCGNLRLRVNAGNLLGALQQLTGVDRARLQLRLGADWSPLHTDFNSLVLKERDGEDFALPVKFCRQLPQIRLAKQEDVNLWRADITCSAIRVQLVKRKGKVFIWTCNDDLITDKLPELVKEGQAFPDDVVLEGEVLSHGNHSLSARLFEQRMGRKVVSKSLVKENPLAMAVRDLLEYGNADLREQPLWRRLTVLEGITRKLNPELIFIAQEIDFYSWEDIENKMVSEKAFIRGVLLRRKHAVYGGKDGDCLQLTRTEKVHTINVVLLYARSVFIATGTLSMEYTFAAWKEGVLIPVAKTTAEGLTKEELEHLNGFVKNNTVEKFGPVKSVRPDLVFELAFTSVQFSNRNKSGFTLVSPQIIRCVQGRSADAAGSLEDFLLLAEK